ncbi:hypothetical protein COX84_05730 [Candidatus Micrarchaeota archaeon CG_4_10_14_0_2_um_filter_49_7]|nr:MAG: hypothetical protein AUJ13_00140 [Candidatus Micrarchaeota archaeon CG1_02_49_24]PIZ93790.1 MAG: hypothetical protein COX84_05730 [Candidatus Micrarchaeota archaeon CG_4_10_14_0_2_um_filter_49_7]HII53498.1 hypothetical protein [Candidatus Micrarchaeota archaeon]
MDDHTASAFSPAHITGFFKILRNNSAGAGFTLEQGMETAVKLDASLPPQSSINLPDAIVSREVVSSYKQYLPKGKFTIKHTPYFPIGYGLGMSAAGALSLSFALNKLTGALTKRQAIRVAHEAEIACGTGLGGVRAESIGGFLYRETGEVERIATPAYDVVIGFLSPIKTKSIIRDDEWKKRINAVGGECINTFARKPSVGLFMRLSREFAFETGLSSGKVMGIMESCKNCSMAMLGNTVFSIANTRQERQTAIKAFKSQDIKAIIASKLSRKAAI